jgi:hypothetical protein
MILPTLLADPPTAFPVTLQSSSGEEVKDYNNIRDFKSGVAAASDNFAHGFSHGLTNSRLKVSDVVVVFYLLAIEPGNGSQTFIHCSRYVYSRMVLLISSDSLTRVARKMEFGAQSKDSSKDLLACY